MMHVTGYTGSSSTDCAFFFTKDFSTVVKTVSVQERDHLLAILPAYTNHLEVSAFCLVFSKTKLQISCSCTKTLFWHQGSRGSRDSLLMRFLALFELEVEGVVLPMIVTAISCFNTLTKYVYNFVTSKTKLILMKTKKQVAKNFIDGSVGVDEMYEVRGNPAEDLWVLPNMNIVLLDANFDCRAIGVENEIELEKMRAVLQEDIEFLQDQGRINYAGNYVARKR